MTPTTPTLSDKVLSSLWAACRGPVITPGDEAYDEARAVYNAMIDRRPAAVIRAADEADAMAVIRTAAEHDLSLAVRGGGHSVPGFGTCDGGLVLDLGGLRQARVDPAARTARVGGGAILGDVDHATHAYGLAVPAGFNSTTGVGGLTLGGGVAAYIGRRFGLTCDSLRSADVVTAEGERVTASATSHDDLFWALRGGGGNFGVVTSFEFDLHPVKELTAGPIFFEIEAAAELMRFYRQLLKDAPRELGGFIGFHLAPPLPFIPEKRHGDPMCVIVFSWSGDRQKADHWLSKVRKAGPVVAEHVGRVPYPAMQSAFDGLLPHGMRHYWKADFVAELTDDCIAAHLEYARSVPTVSSAMHLYPIDGAVHDVDPAATAFAHRDAAFALNIVAVWPDAADTDANVRWVRDYYDAVHPHSGYEGGYINFMAEDDAKRVRANFGSTWDRLVEVKRRWDPENRFRLNQNVMP